MDPHMVSSEKLGDCIVPERLILDRLRFNRRFTVEELLGEIPELSWAQLFLAIDVLSRRGVIQLRRQGFTYTVMKPQRSTTRMDEIDATAPSDYR